MKRDKRLESLDDCPPVDPALARAPLPPELCEHIGFMLGKARQELIGRLDPLAAPLGLTIRHFGIGLLLSRRGALRQTELADMLRLDRTTVMNMVDELERAGFVRREADPKDRRANAVTPTPLGKRWLEKLRPQAEKAERDFLAPLTEAEQDTLRNLLERLVSHAGAGG
jgi:DNA-binding MarR family transcriptional regulator